MVEKTADLMVGEMVAMKVDLLVDNLVAKSVAP